MSPMERAVEAEAVRNCELHFAYLENVAAQRDVPEGVIIIHARHSYHAS